MAGTRGKLVNPWPDLTVRVILEDNGEAILEEKTTILTFDTQKGKHYRIEPISK